MNKGNDYRKMFRMDHFGRRYYCKHARLNQARSDKLRSKRKVRHCLDKLVEQYE